VDRAPRASWHRRAGTNGFRPQLETLEDRTVPATFGSLNLPLNLSDLVVQGTGDSRQLSAIVTTIAGREAAITNVDLTTEAAQQNGCTVLDLHLAPIHLNVLGLHVDTSDICLKITGDHNAGLLGQLVCDLSTSQNLTQILDQLGAQLNTLLDGLENLLAGALTQQLAAGGMFGTTADGGSVSTPAGFCDVLNLSLGPVDLNLLGLNVHLDNCADGPVTVDVTAEDNGGILGDLLCNLSDQFDLGSINTAKLLQRVDRLIDRVTVLADRLERVGDLSSQLNTIVQKLENFADKIHSNGELRALTGRLNVLVSLLDAQIASRA